MGARSDPMSQSIRRDHEAPRGAGDLPTGWRALRDCNLSGRLRDPVVVPLVLVHAEVGVALVETRQDCVVENAEAVLRARLADARFDGIFPGYLPIVHVAVPVARLSALDAILAEAFAALPPLSLPGGDAWATVVERALALRDARRMPPPIAEEPGPPHRQAFGEGPAGPRHAPFAETPAPLSAPAFLAGQGAAQGWPGSLPPQPAPMPRDPVFLRRHDAPVERDLPPEPEPPPEPPRGGSRPWPWALAGLAAGAAIGGALALLLPAGTAEDARPGASPPPIAALASPPGPAVADRPAASPPAAAPAAAATAPEEARPAATAPDAPRPPSAAPHRPRPPPEAASAPPEMATAPTPPPAPRAEADPPEPLPLVSVRSPANLRRGPSTSNPVIRTTRRGETFHVHGTTEDDWMEVGDASTAAGWIHGSLLREVPR